MCPYHTEISLSMTLCSAETFLIFKAVVSDEWEWLGIARKGILGDFPVLSKSSLESGHVRPLLNLAGMHS